MTNVPHQRTTGVNMIASIPWVGLPVSARLDMNYILMRSDVKVSIPTSSRHNKLKGLQ